MSTPRWWRHTVGLVVGIAVGLLPVLRTTEVMAEVPFNAAHLLATTAEAPTRRPWSIMVAPLFLLAPIGELTAEVSLSRRFAVAAMAGAGRVAVRSPSLTTHLTTYNAGAQLQYYALGDFRHGMQIGLQVLYDHYDSPFAHQFLVDGNAAQLGPFMGYKLVLDLGFTIEIQIGYQKTWIWQHTSDDPAGLVTRIDDSGLLLNLNTGWSF